MAFALSGMCYPGCAAALVGLVVVVVSTISVCLNKLSPSLSAPDLVPTPAFAAPSPPTTSAAPRPSSSDVPLCLQIWAPTELFDFRHRLHELVIPWDSTMSSSFYHR
jgi:hypothetical protein